MPASVAIIIKWSITRVGGDTERSKALDSVDYNINQGSHFGKGSFAEKKLKIGIPE